MSNRKSGGYYAVRGLEKLRLDFGGVCNHNGCTTKEDLQFAHRLPTTISGMGRGSSIRLKDIRNNPAHYILLCPLHHLEFDTNAGINLILK